MKIHFRTTPDQSKFVCTEWKCHIPPFCGYHQLEKVLTNEKSYAIYFK